MSIISYFDIPSHQRHNGNELLAIRMIDVGIPIADWEPVHFQIHATPAKGPGPTSRRQVHQYFRNIDRNTSKSEPDRENSKTLAWPGDVGVCTDTTHTPKLPTATALDGL